MECGFLIKKNVRKLPLLDPFLLESAPIVAFFPRVFIGYFPFFFPSTASLVMDTLPRETIELIVQFAASCYDLPTFANLGLVCRDFRAALPDPLLYFPTKYLGYYVDKRDTDKVMEILSRITKEVIYGHFPVYETTYTLPRTIFNSLLKTAYYDPVEYTLIEAIFLHDILRTTFTPGEHRRALGRMISVGNMDYLLKALRCVDFLWDVDIKDPIYQTMDAINLTDILGIMLGTKRCTIDEAVRILPEMFRLEPNFYKCFSIEQNDIFIFHYCFRLWDEYTGIIAEMPEQIRPVFDAIVSKKKDGLQIIRTLPTSVLNTQLKSIVETNDTTANIKDPMIKFFMRHIIRNVPNVAIAIMELASDEE